MFQWRALGCHRFILGLVAGVGVFVVPCESDPGKQHCPKVEPNVVRIYEADGSNSPEPDEDEKANEYGSDLRFTNRSETRKVRLVFSDEFRVYYNSIPSNGILDLSPGKSATYKQDVKKIGSKDYTVYYTISFSTSRVQKFTSEEGKGAKAIIIRSKPGNAP